MANINQEKNQHRDKDAHRIEAGKKAVETREQGKPGSLSSAEQKGSEQLHRNS